MLFDLFQKIIIKYQFSSRDFGIRAASQEPEYSNRSASFASVTLNPDFNFWVRVRYKPMPESASPARTAKKLLRRKEE